MARRLAVEIVGDSRDLENKLKRSSKAAKDFKGNVDKAGKGTRKTFGGLGKIAGGLGAAFGAREIVGGIKSSIAASSDLNEEIGKNKVVFKGSGGEIRKWSKTTANSLGISRNEALKATGTFGNMLVPMGFARGKAADMSKTMVALGGDMASFNNASPEDTLDALRAGLAGESEPLRKFGVFLSDARLKQEALNQKIYDGKGPLDATQKAAATYALILKDTKDAQGDAARTGDNWAGTQRRLSALADDLSAKLGTTLLPMITNAANAVADWLGKSRNQNKVMETAKGVAEALTAAVKVLRGAWHALTVVVGGNKNAVKALIGVYATWKVLVIAGKVSTLAANMGTLRGKTNGAKNAARGFRGSLAGKAGVAGAVVLAGYELSNLIRQIPGWDNAMRNFGGTIYDLASNLGLVNDQMAQFQGKKTPGQAGAGQIRRRAAFLEASGATPQQAASRLARSHPNMARHDIDVLAGVHGRSPIMNVTGGIHLHNVTNPRQLEDELAKRTRRRPRRRRQG